MARVIVYHPDDRHIAVEEDDFENPERNPYNHGGAAVQVDGNTGASISIILPARELDDHVSLKDEGFVVVGEFADADEADKDGNIVIFAGAERARPGCEDLYRGVGLEEASQPSELGRAVAARRAAR